MKKGKTLLVLSISIFLLLPSCVNNSTSKSSKWTEKLKQEFVKENNPQTDFEKFALLELISINEFDKNKNQLDSILNSSGYDEFKKEASKRYVFVVDTIAGKSEKEIEVFLGKPNKKEEVSPSGLPCSCNKYTYIYGLIEIVYINGKSDWITINTKPGNALVKKGGSYQSVDFFDDYVYVKVSTK